tara:strand:- start:272 stop:532 length:261 start_codon:yes stop_codon:yes gene_type:complete
VEHAFWESAFVVLVLVEMIVARNYLVIALVTVCVTVGIVSVILASKAPTVRPKSFVQARQHKHHRGAPVMVFAMMVHAFVLRVLVV